VRASISSSCNSHYLFRVIFGGVTAMDGKYDTGWKPGNDVEEIYQLGKACVAGVAGFNIFGIRMG